MDFSAEEQLLIAEAWSLQKNRTSTDRTKQYLNFVLTLNDKNRRQALLDLAELDQWENHSAHIRQFMELDKKIQKKIKAKKITGVDEQNRFTELFYGCRALRPNDVNKNAAKDFKRFNFALNLGTLSASYAYYNMDKDLNGEWFAKLGYEVGVTVLFTYVGGNIQTKATDTQIVKSLKSYFMGRVMGATDIVFYDPFFNDEREKARKKIDELRRMKKDDPAFRAKTLALEQEYRKRGLYRELKDAVIKNIKEMRASVGFGIKGQSIDENGIDWNSLTPADLEKPEVQDVLVAAAMAQVYQESKGDWIETSNAGVDRYVFNSLFYGIQIPKSIVQNFITYQILCMGQDNPKFSFMKAVLFNVTTNFLVNQVLYGYREKAINQ